MYLLFVPEMSTSLTSYVVQINKHQQLMQTAECTGRLTKPDKLLYLQAVNVEVKVKTAPLPASQAEREGRGYSSNHPRPRG